MSINSARTSGVLHLDTYWPYQIIVLADRLSRRTAAIVKQHGLNLSQWRGLAAIGEAPGRTSVEVGSITPMDKGIVSRATKGLLEHGLIYRTASQSDGRISHLHLTEAGVKLYGALFPQVEAILKQANAHLSAEEQAHLSENLRTLLKVLPDLR